MLKAFSFLSLVLFLFVPNVYGATLYIDPNNTTLNRGDAFTASVRIMPNKEAGECINTVDATLHYTENIQPVDTSIGQSIFSIWIEEPTINKEERTITFAGGIPNGYCGRVDGDPRLTNVVADIIFRSPGFQIGGSEDDGVAEINFGSETQVLLNDGQGTRADLETYGAVVNLEKMAGATIVDLWRESVRNDNISPEEFSISLNRDEAGVNFNGRYYIVFSAVDKQTGISHYEVMEEPVSSLGSFDWGGVGVPWIKAESPYTIKDQSLNSIIRVKAVDKAGNEYVATFIPDESLKTISQNQIYMYATLFIMFIITLIILFVIHRLFKKRRIINKENQESVME